MQVSNLLEVLGSRTGIPKGLKKMPNSEGKGGLANFGIQRAWGDVHFGISEGKGGGVKILIPTMVGYGYFLESPNMPFYSCVLSYLAINASEAGGDLALIQTCLLFSCKCQLGSIRTT